MSALSNENFSPESAPKGLCPLEPSRSDLISKVAKALYALEPSRSDLIRRRKCFERIYC